MLYPIELLARDLSFYRRTRAASNISAKCRQRSLPGGLRLRGILTDGMQERGDSIAFRALRNAVPQRQLQHRR